MIVRRNIDELVARYTLEPSLRDIYVEGHFDVNCLNAFLEEKKIGGVKVYDIQTVNVPKELVGYYGFTLGNKQRVISLAHELHSRNLNASYICLVDADLDRWTGSEISLSRLYYTKYTCIEMVFLEEQSVRRFLVYAAESKIPSWEPFFLSFIETLRCLFAIRLANERHKYFFPIVPPTKRLSFTNGQVSLDLKSYIAMMSVNAGEGHATDRLTLEVNEILLELRNFEPRLVTHGHDFVSLMAWVVGQGGGNRSFRNEVALQGLLQLAFSQLDTSIYRSSSVFLPAVW